LGTQIPVVHLELKKGPPPNYESRGKTEKKKGLPPSKISGKKILKCFFFFSFFAIQGFCFVQFPTHKKADEARKVLNKSVIKTRALYASWAENRNKHSNDPELLEKVKTLFVSNISVSVTEEELLSIFSEFGKVLNCVIVKHQVTQQPRGFAFIEFAVKILPLTHYALHSLSPLNSLTLPSSSSHFLRAK
jgi:RNA recognition motif-containing protein